MSQEAVVQATQRATTDQAFVDQLMRDPDAALTGYDLSPEERALLLSGVPSEAGSSEMSDEQLAEVAGGLANTQFRVNTLTFSSNATGIG
jgi:hypothetical protein